MPGRNEGQLLRAIAQGRPGQAFNKGLTVVAIPKLGSNEQWRGPRKPYANGVCRVTWTVSTCKRDQAAEWRLTISDGEMLTIERDSRSGCSHAGADIRRSGARDGALEQRIDLRSF